MIDTHVHFNGKDLGGPNTLPGVIERATVVGVRQFIVVGYDLPSSERAVRIAADDARIWATIGIHPHDAQHYDTAAETRLRALAADSRVVAIGEIGLDFYRDLSPRDAQDTAFRAQIALAQETRLPIVIHCRDAYPETTEILEAEAGTTPVILHCFAGDASYAARAFDRGWFLGIGGSVTYKKNDELRAIVKSAPENALLLETDAPYLSPEPLRGKFPNEPARVALVAERIAEIRGEPIHEVWRYTTENALQAFPRMTES